MVNAHAVHARAAQTGETGDPRLIGLRAGQRRGRCEDDDGYRRGDDYWQTVRWHLAFPPDAGTRVVTDTAAAAKGHTGAAIRCVCVCGRARGRYITIRCRRTATMVVPRAGGACRSAPNPVSTVENRG